MGPKSLADSGRIVALFPALLGIGGIQKAGRLTALALSQIASSQGRPVDFLSLNDPAGTQAFTCDQTSLAFRGFGRAATHFIVAAMGRAVRGTAVVVAAHPHLAPVAAAMKLSRPRLETVVISHGVEVWQRLPPLRRGALRMADLLIAPSRHTVEQLLRVQGASLQRTKRLPWPVDPDLLEIAAQRETLRPPAGFPKGLVVLTAARLAAKEKYKGVDCLIRAVAVLASQYPSLYLAVAGGGDDLPRHQLLAHDLGIQNRVCFLQQLTAAELAACYSQCDLFALPSTGEGFGFVFLEAMAFGKPVIGAAAGGVTDIIVHEQNGLLVPPGDSTHLVESLERLLAKETLRFELGQKGAQTTRLRFHFGDFRARLEEALSGLSGEADEKQ